MARPNNCWIVLTTDREAWRDNLLITLCQHLNTVSGNKSYVCRSFETKDKFKFAYSRTGKELAIITVWTDALIHLLLQMPQLSAVNLC